MIEPKDILFIGAGKSAVGWYRCYLPALHMGADWIGVGDDPPPGLKILTGLVRRDTRMPDYEDYKVVILQQPAGRDWLKLIRRLQGQGIKVLYEIDDYLHGVRKQKGHHYGQKYNKRVLADIELCMRVCDGMVCSTEWLARRMRKFNPNVYVCRNGIDMQRYQLTRPERSTVNIGWAGATGHALPIREWLREVAHVMRERDDTKFVSIGMPEYAEDINYALREERAIGTPWTLIENYPAAMTMIDVAIAPAGKTSWYRAKSDLRWLEASALGIPLVADPTVYPDIEHGVTGFHAESLVELRELLFELVDDPALRRRVGDAAKQHVVEHRDISVACLQWLETAGVVVGESTSVHS